MIPKSLRDHLGLRSGAVEVVADGSVLRVEPLVSEDLEERDGHLFIPASGADIDDDTVRALRDGDRR